MSRLTRPKDEWECRVAGGCPMEDYILNHVRRNQVFITCCDISNTLRLQKGKVYRMENGNCPDGEETENEV